jgi:hypothetical protein
MRDYVVGFIACACLFSLTALSPQLSNRHKTEQEVEAEFTNIYLNMQPRQHTVLTSSPAVSDLNEASPVFVKSGNGVSLFIRVNNSTYSFTGQK